MQMQTQMPYNNQL